MNPKRVVISGYATLDYVIQLASPFHGIGTTAGETGLSGAWPRAGGAALYASRRIAAAGHRAFPLTWIGDDGDGGHYLRACQREQICSDAIYQHPGAKTPRCVLIYHPDGSYGCLLDTGFAEQECLIKDQLDIAASADHVCISAGPPRPTAALLDAMPFTTDISWIAKLDAAAFPVALRAELADRAKFIFCNASEREFVESARRGDRPRSQVIVETLGSAGVLIDCEQGQRIVAIEAIATHDTTGAGDTLAGEVIAQIVSGHVSVDVAVQAGIRAARNLLAERTLGTEARRQ